MGREGGHWSPASLPARCLWSWPRWAGLGPQHARLRLDARPPRSLAIMMSLPFSPLPPSLPPPPSPSLSLACSSSLSLSPTHSRSRSALSPPLSLPLVLLCLSLPPTMSEGPATDRLRDSLWPGPAPAQHNSAAGSARSPLPADYFVRASKPSRPPSVFAAAAAVAATTH